MRAILALICLFLQTGKSICKFLRTSCIRSSKYGHFVDNHSNLFIRIGKIPSCRSMTHVTPVWQIIDLYAVSVAAQRTPTISYISQEQIKDIGETVEMQCSVQYGQDYPVLWIKVNKESVHEQVALSTGTALIIRDSRFALKYDTASSTYILQVRLHWMFLIKIHSLFKSLITWD